MDGKGNSRLQYIDVLKGIAIILVLIGHRSVNEYVTVFIYMFHMPLFFFIDSAPDAGSLLCPSSSLASLPGKLQDAYE